MQPMPQSDRCTLSLSLYSSRSNDFATERGWDRRGKRNTKCYTESLSLLTNLGSGVLEEGTPFVEGKLPFSSLPMVLQSNGPAK
jgi:hypothetical protein